MIMDQFVEQLRQVSPLSDEIVGQLLEEMKEVLLLRENYRFGREKEIRSFGS